MELYWSFPTWAALNWLELRSPKPPTQTGAATISHLFNKSNKIKSDSINSDNNWLIDNENNGYCCTTVNKHAHNPRSNKKSNLYVGIVWSFMILPCVSVCATAFHHSVRHEVWIGIKSSRKECQISVDTHIKFSFYCNLLGMYEQFQCTYGIKSQIGNMGSSGWLLCNTPVFCILNKN